MVEEVEQEVQDDRVAVSVAEDDLVRCLCGDPGCPAEESFEA